MVTRKYAPSRLLRLLRVGVRDSLLIPLQRGSSDPTPLPSCLHALLILPLLLCLQVR